MDGLADVLAEATRHNSAVIAGGDFNATVDHAQFRHLLSGGYRDAAEQAGAGFVPTYPTDYPFPPLLPWTTSSRTTSWRMQYSACGYPDRTIEACR